MGLFLESSAKSGFNAQKVFIEAGLALYKNYNEYIKKRGSFGSSQNDSIQNIDAFNDRVRFPTQANLNGKDIKSKSKCPC